MSRFSDPLLNGVHYVTRYTGVIPILTETVDDMVNSFGALSNGLLGTQFENFETRRLLAAGLNVTPLSEAQSLDISDALLGTPEEGSLGEAVDEFGSILLGVFLTRSAFVKGMSKFGLSEKTIKAAQASTIVNFGEDFVSGFIFEDPDQKRLADFLPERYNNEIIDWLRKDESESQLEARLKNATEAAIVGAVSAPLIDATLRGLRSIVKSSKDAAKHIHKGDSESIARAVEDQNGFPKGSIGAIGIDNRVPAKLPEEPSLKLEDDISGSDIVGVPSATKKSKSQENLDKEFAENFNEELNTLLKEGVKPEDLAETSAMRGITKATDDILMSTAMSRTLTADTAPRTTNEDIIDAGRKLIEESTFDEVSERMRETAAQLPGLNAAFREVTERMRDHLKGAQKEYLAGKMTLTDYVTILNRTALIQTDYKYLGSKMGQGFQIRRGNLSYYDKAAGEAWKSGKASKDVAEAADILRANESRVMGIKAGSDLNELTERLAQEGADSVAHIDDTIRDITKQIEDAADIAKKTPDQAVDKEVLGELNESLEILRKMKAEEEELLRIASQRESLDPLDDQIKDLTKKQKELEKSLKERRKELERQSKKEAKRVQKEVEKLLNEIGGNVSKGKTPEKTQFNKFLDFIHILRLRNMLSGVPTFVLNNVGNYTNAVASMTADAVGGFFKGDATALATFNESMSIYHQSLYRYMGVFAKATTDMKTLRELTPGLSTKLDEAVTEAGDSRHLLENAYIKLTGKDESPFLSMLDKYSHMLSLGHLGASDALFQRARYETYTVMNAKKYIQRNGKVPANLIDSEADILLKQLESLQRDDDFGKKLIEELGEEKGLERLKLLQSLDDDAKNSALKATFQNTTDHRTIEGLQQWLNNGGTGSQLTKVFVMPFFRTPTNLILEALRYTPATVMSSRQRAILADAAHPEHNAAVGKLVIGATGIGAASMLAINGDMTGAHPASERQKMIQSGIPEYSIRIPGYGWVAYGRTEPFGTIMGIVADSVSIIRRANGDPEVTNRVQEVIMGSTVAFGQNLLNKTWFKGLSDASLALAEPSRFMQAYGEGQARTTFGYLGAFQRTVEAVIVEDNMGEFRRQKVSEDWLSLRFALDVIAGDLLEDLGNPTQRNILRDPLGDPVRAPDRLSYLFGVKNTPDVESPAVRELGYLRAMPSSRNLTLSTGYRMTDDEDTEFKRVLSEEVQLRKRLDEVVTSPGYQRLSDQQRVKVMTKIISKARKLAKGITLRDNPELRSNVIKFEQKRLLQALKEGVPDEERTNVDILEGSFGARRVLRDE